MKMIIAVVRPERLDEVREALVQADISRITATRTTGHGRAAVDANLYRGQVLAPNMSPGVRIEIAVNDDFVEPAIAAICGAAGDANSRGGGKIFVLPLEQCIRISTNERGSDAI